MVYCATGTSTVGIADSNLYRVLTTVCLQLAPGTSTGRFLCSTFATGTSTVGILLDWDLRSVISTTTASYRDLHGELTASPLHTEAFYKAASPLKL